MSEAAATLKKVRAMDLEKNRQLMKDKGVEEAFDLIEELAQALESQIHIANLIRGEHILLKQQYRSMLKAHDT